jgi:hypothetical protein
MSKLISPLAAGALPFLACLGASPAQAASPVTFVSGRGTDSGTCASPATACRTFQFAIGQTNAGGEIKALDPANYGGATISKSISLTGVDGAGIDRAGGPVAITINAGPNDTINLSHLTLDGLKTAQNGILLNSGGSLTISYCTVRNFKSAGISAISPNPNPIGATKITLDHVFTHNNADGIFINGNAASTLAVVDSTASDNVVGIHILAGHLQLAHSTVTGNSFAGVSQEAVPGALSAGNNFIAANGHDVIGILLNVGTQ